jgi:glycosyltransferase involved in cell wall biosynthesis
MVFLEAWVQGKPVVGARSGAAASFIEEGVDGLLVDFGDIAALAGSIRGLLEQPEAAAVMGANGHAKAVSSFSWAYQYARLQGVVRAVMVGSEI